MKKIILSALFLMGGLTVTAQEPAIEGDVLLCPDSEGTAYVATDMAYDSYQWYVDFYPYDEFEPVDGATEASFTYDTYTYSVSKIKVVTTIGANTYHSNVLTIDSLGFLPIFFSTELQGDVTFDPNFEHYVLCGEGAITSTIGNPYTNVQWYKDGEEIEGATSQEYIITGPGVYYGIASPAECPDYTDTTLPIEVVLCNIDEPDPIIEGDELLCPGSEGTAALINDMNYDTYQWFWKPVGGLDDFTEIEGADGPIFTYDAFAYNNTIIKLVVTFGEETYESNLIEITTYMWTPLLVATLIPNEAEYDPETGIYTLCEGDGFTHTIEDIYTNAQWFRNGEPIEGATDTSYTITEPGIYHVEGAPFFCPDNTSSTENEPIIVEVIECTMGTEDPHTSAFSIYPNPANNILNLSLPGNSALSSYTIIDVTGKILLSGTVTAPQTPVDIASLAQGTYIIKLAGENTGVSKMFIKK